MPVPFDTALPYALIPVGALVAGGALAAFRPPPPRWRAVIQHFAAGVVFAVVAVELLPDLRRRHDTLEMAASFGLGVAAMLGLRSLLGGGDNKDGVGGGTDRLPWGLVAAVGIDLVIDGLLLGVGFAAGAKAGALLALALAAECLSLGLATASAVAKSPGVGRGAVVLVSAGLALAFAAGAGGGLTLLSGASGHALTWVLSFGCAALLYLVTEELLVEAHEVPDTPLATAMFFAGFLLFLLLGMAE